jgi:polysaccharide pyruvyl transferase WcaK-like protein
MNCGIITHYDVHNHGAVLQLLALKNVLRDQFEIEAQALKFDKNYDFLGPELKNKYELSLKSFHPYWEFLRKRGISAVRYNFNKRRTLERFKIKNNIVGRFYTAYSNLDYIIIGSDEVFALHTGATPVFFGHGLPSNRVLAYAASFGPTTLEDIYSLHCESLVGSGIKRMQGVSVRDKNSKDIVNSLLGINVPIVVDPVLLYGFEKEIPKQKRHLEEKYMVVYAYDKRMNSANEVHSIKQFAHKNGLKIVSPGFYHKWVDINVNIDPVELLGWFKYADYIVTDTFHGAVMSLITNRPFSVIIRDNSNKLMNLIQEYNLEDRLVRNIELDLKNQFQKHIDYEDVNEKIKIRRSFSLHYLQQQLNGKEN